MSRSRTWLFVFIYFAAAAAFRAYEFQLDHQFWKLDGATAVLIIGGSLVPLVGGAIIAMIGWAFSKLSARYVGAVIILWLVIGGTLAFLSDYVNRFDRRLQLGKMTNDSFLTGRTGTISSDR
jgi:predicted ribosomally synthesized peptide with SipW-like signal peptide